MVDRRKEGRERANKLLRKSGYGDGDGALSTASGKKGGKWGPARFANGGVVEEVVEGEMPSGRLDKGKRGKRNGKTTVNVIVSGKSGGGDGLDNGVPDNPEQAFQAGVQAGIKQSAPPPAPPAPPMPPPGMAPPGGPPMMPGMKKGGRVKMDAGAGGGEGRLEKTAKAARAKNKMINSR